MKPWMRSAFESTIQFLRSTGIGRWRPVVAAYGFCVSALKRTDVPIEVLGHRMWLDPTDSLELSVRGIYGPFETEVLAREIKAGDVVVDIGANIGYHTLLFARGVGKAGKVYAFEPVPENFSILEKNVALNGYGNVERVPKAVSDVTGVQTLYLCESSSGMHQIFDAHAGRNTIEVETVRLDDYFSDYNGRIDFIKMDIEGAEGKAVQGMLHVLSTHKTSKLSTEFYPKALQDAGTDPELYLKQLQGMGFHLYEINEQQRRLDKVDISELVKRASVVRDFVINLLCLRSPL